VRYSAGEFNYNRTVFSSDPELTTVRVGILKKNGEEMKTKGVREKEEMEV
jgi:hypothetical protein